MRTLLLSVLATNLVSTLVIILFWKQSHNRLKGVLYWVTTVAFQTIGLLLILFRGLISDWFTIILPNLFLVTGMYLGLLGFYKFLNRKSNQWFNVILIAIYSIPLIYYTFYNYNTAIRIIIFSAFVFIICLQGAIVLFYKVPDDMKYIARKLGIVFLLYCGISLVRIGNALLFGNQSNDLFSPAGFDIAIMLLYQVMLILMTYNLVLMFNQKLIQDIRTEEEKFSKAFYSSPTAVSIIRADDGEIVDVNKSFLRLTGYTYEEVVGKINSNLHLWVNASDWEKLITDMSREGNIENRILHFRKKTGSVLIGIMSAELLEINSKKCVLISFNDLTVQRDIENTLKESEKQLRSFVEFGMDAILLTAPDGRIFSANPSACELFGYTEEEFMKLGRSGLVDTTDSRLEILLNERQRNGKARGELTMIRKGGFKFSVEVSSAIFTNKEGEKRSSMIIRDITDRKIAEKALIESKEHFRSLFVDNLSVMLLVDPLTGSIVEANAAAEKYYGWTLEQLVNMNIQDINVLEGDAYKGIEKEIYHDTLHLELKHRKSNDLICEVEVFSSRISIVGKEFLHLIVHDITIRKEAEKQVLLLSRALEQSPVSLMITNKEGNLVFVNSKFTETTGYSYDEVINQNPRLLKSEDNNIDFYKNLWDTLLSGNIWQGEFRNKKKNGELYWAKSIISAINNNKGEITYFVAVQEDVTDLKKLNADLIDAKEKAEESDKLKTAFLNTILHETRTPINAIVGFSDILNGPDISTEMQKQFMEIISKSSYQLLRIITDIVNVATINAGQEKVNEKSIDIIAVCRLVYNQFLPVAKEKNLLFDFSNGVDSNEFIVSTDDVKLTQILSNLVGNALKFTHEGSVSFGYVEKGEMIEFYVQDSGIGIAPEVQQEIFELFRQVDYSNTRKFGGSGLGLTISKAYVEMLGGEIWLYSERNGGTVFYFTIPYKFASQSNKSASISFDKGDYLGPEKVILVVEDEINNFKLIKEILRKSHIELIYAENGIEAIECCKNRNDIDLILMDIMMPVMGGYEASAEIRKFYRNIPIVAQTAYVLDFDQQHALECGITDYISKPFKRTEFLHRVKNLISQVVV